VPWWKQFWFWNFSRSNVLEIWADANIGDGLWISHRRSSVSWVRGFLSNIRQKYASLSQEFTDRVFSFLRFLSKRHLTSHADHIGIKCWLFRSFSS
jgi:hypothetical protein